MLTLSTKGFPDYELLDSGDGARLERYGKYRLVRPDPQCIWKRKLSFREWNSVDAGFQKLPNSREGWKTRHYMPERWKLHYNHISFYARLTPFKHTGVFPEQVLQWEFLQSVILNAVKDLKHQPNILNLFGYTGIASLVAAKAGAKVTHLDASKSSV